MRRAKDTARDPVEMRILLWGYSLRFTKLTLKLRVFWKAETNDKNKKPPPYGLRLWNWTCFWSNESLFVCPSIGSVKNGTRYLRQFPAGACSKTMAITITKISTKVFSHSSNTNIYLTTHSIVENFSDRNWSVLGPESPSPWSDGSSCWNYVEPNRPFEQRSNNQRRWNCIHYYG
jgi:hypothetical protein